MQSLTIHCGKLPQRFDVDTSGKLSIDELAAARARNSRLGYASAITTFRSLTHLTKAKPQSRVGDENGSLSQVDLEQILLSFDATLSISQHNAIIARFDKTLNWPVDIYQCKRALERTNASKRIAVEIRIGFMGRHFKDLAIL